MIRAFVSSISVGLEDTRRQIIADLRTAGFDVNSMEQFGAQPQPPIDVCLREVRKADVVILLMGPRYGSLLPQGISYTHAEFREAQGAGTPVLAFRIANAPDLTTEDRDRLDSFVTEVGSTAVYQALSPSEPLERLSAMVLAHISRLAECLAGNPRHESLANSCPYQKAVNRPGSRLICLRGETFDGDIDHLVPGVKTGW